MAIVFPYVTNKFTAYLGDERITRLSLAIRLTDDFTKEEPMGNIKISIHEGERKREDIKIIKNLSGYYVINDLVTGDYMVSIESDNYFPEKIPVRIKEKEVSLAFDGNGPARRSLKAKLQDVSKLEIDDVVELRNPFGNSEQKKITNIDNNNKEISWEGRLKYDFNAQESAIRVLKYLFQEIPLKPAPSYPFPRSATPLTRHVTLLRGSIDGIDQVDKIEAEVGGEKKEFRWDEKGEFILYFKGSDNVTVTVNIKKKDGTVKEISPLTIKAGTVGYLRKISLSR